MSLASTAAIVARFAHQAVGQKRKYTGDPYWVHPSNVVTLLVGKGLSQHAIAAAWLHDTVEDTQITLTDIQLEFGPKVTIYVDWLTERRYPGMNRAARKQHERERLSVAPDEVQSIKLADLIDNTASIVEYDPDFARVYLREKEALLGALDRGHPELRTKAQNVLIEALEALKYSRDRS
jgi:(p)ppGpp synthase/HD superfamily hydrolase